MAKSKSVSKKASKRIEWHVERWPLAKLKPYDKNPRIISEAGLKDLKNSFDEIGVAQPININLDGTILSGHARFMELQAEGAIDTDVYVPDRKLTPKQEEAVIIRMNKNVAGTWDPAKLLNDFDLEDLSNWGFTQDELDALAVDSESAEGSAESQNLKLSERFLIPPFSVFNAREGWWQNRKDSWIALGIKSEVGRGSTEETDKKEIGGTLMKSWTSHPSFYPQKQDREKKLGRELSTAEFLEKYFIPPTDGAYASGTSIFDPVLCEIAYRWFSPEKGLIIDPFAGGSVRGIVASKLNRFYMGGELRQEQVDANVEQGDALCANSIYKPLWKCADSRIINKTFASHQADLIFSCPPYADLEVYSDDPNDISTLNYSEFRKVYFEIIKKSCLLLKDNRFACFVVGEVRDKKGNYYDFVGDTVQAFKDAGLEYYNEAILVTAVGSLPIRSGRTFSASRKLGKTHQNILVFVKGNAKEATKACGVVDVATGEELEDAIGAGE